MLGLIPAHPGIVVAGQPGIPFRVLDVPALARGAVQFGCPPFHVIGPGRLFVTVRRMVGIPLLNPFFRPPDLVHLTSCLQTSLGECVLARVVFPRLVSQPHRGGVPPGDVRDPRRFALVLTQTLRFAVREIDDACLPLAPAIVGRLVWRQPEADVVPVVGYLVIQRIGRGVHLEHPLEAPTRLVEQVRNAVRAGIPRASTWSASRPPSARDPLARRYVRSICAVALLDVMWYFSRSPASCQPPVASTCVPGGQGPYAVRPSCWWHIVPSHGL